MDDMTQEEMIKTCMNMLVYLIKDDNDNTITKEDILNTFRPPKPKRPQFLNDEDRSALYNSLVKKINKSIDDYKEVAPDKAHILDKKRDLMIKKANLVIHS